MKTAVERPDETICLKSNKAYLASDVSMYVTAQNKNCIICGNESFELFCFKGEGTYLKCRQCEHVSVAGGFNTDLSEKRSSAGSHHISDVKRSWDFSLEKREKIFLPRLLRIASFTQVGKLLDIGSSNGAFIEASNYYGWKAEGVELRPSSVEFAKKRGLIVHNRHLEDLNIPQLSFDAVSMWQVIEHIPNPENLLKECHKILRKDGVLALSTPNVASIGWKLLKSEWPAVDPSCHCHLFRINTIRKLMERCGFIECSLGTLELQPATVKQLKRKLFRQLEKKPSNAMAILVGSSNPAQLKIFFMFRKLLNIPLRATGLGEDIYGYFRKISRPIFEESDMFGSNPQ